MGPGISVFTCGPLGSAAIEVALRLTVNTVDYLSFIHNDVERTEFTKNSPAANALAVLARGLAAKLNLYMAVINFNP